MESSELAQVRVGHVEISLDTAAAWIAEYTDVNVNVSSDRPYAFPAYDRYDGGTTERDTLTDGDLLAPVLLNVQVKIRTFYGLQRIRSVLEAGLAHPALEEPLATADFDDVAAAVRALYGVLDEDEAPWGLGGTTLSKVLHRKRPHALVLHDRWIWNCYVGEGALVPSARRGTRSWADYMVLVTEAIGNDIASQPEAFARLRKATSEEVSDVRLLDILAWKSKGDSPSDEPENLSDETVSDPR